MIAELHGKISGSGSNLSDRLEDNLTGDVFGALRYLPFQVGMAQILKAAHIENLAKYVSQLELSYWGDCIRFWPYHELGELDVFLEFDNAVIGIEVKYLSGLSSDDEVDNSISATDILHEESRNQLARESRIVKEWSYGQKPAYLLFVANDSACAPICQNVQDRNILAPGVSLGYVSWQEILAQLSRLTPESPHERLIVDDLIQLLNRKGFERFHSFQLNNCENIDPNEYFSFDYTPLEFTFNLPQIVHKGDYYEYR